MPPLGPGMEQRSVWWAILGLSTLVLLIISLVVQPPQRKRLGWGLGMALFAMLALSMAACGGGGGGGGGVYHNPGTPAGTYTLTITGTAAGSANLQHSMTLTLKVG
jgi:hypothetical protein